MCHPYHTSLSSERGLIDQFQLMGTYAMCLKFMVSSALGIYFPHLGGIKVNSISIQYIEIIVIKFKFSHISLILASIFETSWQLIRCNSETLVYSQQYSKSSTRAPSSSS